MQQTVDAVVETKDLTDVVADSETTLVSGSSYFFYSVAAIAGAETVVDADAVATTAVSGSSSYSSSVADSATTAVVLTVAVVDADATICAANSKMPRGEGITSSQSVKSFCLPGGSFSYFLQ